MPGALGSLWSVLPVSLAPPNKYYLCTALDYSQIYITISEVLSFIIIIIILLHRQPVP